MKSHFATSSWGGKRKPTRAFTEHGAIMAGTVLNSPRARQLTQPAEAPKRRRIGFVQD